jgi:HAD superfamily hydrolase (TIGR01490 family)
MSGNSHGLAVFDLDGTVASGDTFRAYLLACLSRSPSRWHRVPELAGAVALFAAGRRDNTWMKCAFLGAIFGGRKWEALEQQTEAFVAALLRNSIRRDALAAMAERRSEGCKLLLATASPDLYVVPLAQRLGFDDVLCTHVARDAEGRLLGTLQDGNCHGQAKLQRVLAWRTAAGVGGPMWAYSDHHADLPLLTAADVAFATSASRRLRAVAPTLGIRLVEWG